MRLTRKGRIASALGVLILILVLLAVPVFLWLRSLGLLKESSPHGNVSFVIPKGAGTSEVGDILAEKQIVPSSLGFRFAVYLEGGAEDIQAGRYELPKDLSAKDALARLLDGPAPPEVVRLTFPEGSWLKEFAGIVEGSTNVSFEQFVKVATSGSIRSSIQPRSVDTLEGLLFPSTYEFPRRVEAADIIERLVDEFESKLKAAGGRAAAAKLGVTPYEAVIVASMIEAEAFVDSERPKIASVIYNRLDEGMRLGIDATIIYGLGDRGRELTDADLASDSPYNTRVVAGLPPTPIGSPGLSSLEAALNPAATNLFYYVLADCEGHHAFSEGFDEFEQNVARYRELQC
ncbi:MAG: endolytic transglycosylase MltG [Actinomycetota bacterium]|nr:endolytic transglycosylase MltG [Actinomycetota bacterium]